MNKTTENTKNGASKKPVVSPRFDKPITDKEAQTMDMSVKQHTALSVPGPTETSGVLKGDLIVPSILLMQSMSGFVKERKALQGDIIRGSTGERLGGIKEPGKPADPVDLIPLSISTTWTIMKKEGNKWVRNEPRTNANDSLPWVFEENGETYKRLKTINLIAILPTDISKLNNVSASADGIPDSLDSAVLLPVAVSFRSTGFNAGKAVATFFGKVESLKKSFPNTKPYHYTLPLTCFEDSNDDGDWYTFDVGTAKKTETKFLDIASEWYTTVTQKSFKVQDDEEVYTLGKHTEAYTGPRQF